jgi:undecaprenyl-diphosphatase
MTNILRPALLIMLLAAFVATGLLGGPASPFDSAIANWVGGLREGHPQFTSFVAVLTQLGSVYATLGVGLLASALLAARRQGRKALLLAATVILERLSVDGLKLAFGRPRPDLDLPFMPSSASFPSGHSANSMAVFVAVALIAAPAAWRRPALVAALSLSIIIGLTRIFLGVHWPSDVIGGWAWGLIVVGLSMAAGRRSDAIEAQHDVARGHLPPIGED